MKRRVWTASVCALAILLLILDTKTAIGGAGQAIDLCIKTAIPSLFPFMLLSMLLTGSLSGFDLAILRPISKQCGIPAGGEVLLLNGILGGYPVGAQTVTLCHQNGQLSRQSARRLLGFCSNAGPAFLFGIVAGKFSQWWMPWIIWAIHIAAAILTGMILPGKEHQSLHLQPKEPIPLPAALGQSLRSISFVCGWIVIFRVIIAYIEKWFLWRIPLSFQPLILGLLELTNGCCQLDSIANEAIRFVAASIMLSFGGICVIMQTSSVVGDLGIKSYILGKLLQTGISLVLSVSSLLLFPFDTPSILPAYMSALMPILLAFLAFILRESEKRCSIPNKIGV